VAVTARDDKCVAKARDERCSTKAVVIGAGVSGCACAAVLAAAGVPVIVFNSSLDAVCHPAYGPLVVVESGGWAQVTATLGMVPRPLREAWLSCSEGVEKEAGFFCIDARRLSVEAKRALEQMPGLQFRQGLIADLRVQRRVSGSRAGQTWGAGFPGHGGEWEVLVETAFGEVVSAAAVVVAVGLNLGGRIELGESVLPGARYGETPGEGVLAALERLGVGLEETVLEVGPRVPGIMSFAPWRIGGDSGALSSGGPLSYAARSEGARSEGPRNDGRGEAPGGVGRSGVLCLEEGAPCAGGSGVRCRGVCSGPVGNGAETEQPQSVLEPAEQISKLGPTEQISKGERRWASLLPLAEILRAGGFFQDDEEWGRRSSWSAEWPPSPYWGEPVRSEDRAVLLSHGPSEGVRTGSADGGEGPEGSARSGLLVAPVLVPDGAATGELYCVAGPGVLGEGELAVFEDGERGECVVMSRRGYKVRGFVVKSLAHGGRLLTKGEGVLPVWVAGRAAGAAGYLESLASGARVGAEVAAYLREEGGCGLSSSCDGCGKGWAG